MLMENQICNINEKYYCNITQKTEVKNVNFQWRILSNKRALRATVFRF